MALTWGANLRRQTPIFCEVSHDSNCYRVDRYEISRPSYRLVLNSQALREVYGMQTNDQRRDKVGQFLLKVWVEMSLTPVRNLA